MDASLISQLKELMAAEVLREATAKNVKAIVNELLWRVTGLKRYM